MNKLKPKHWLIIFILFVVFEGLGLRMTSWGGLGGSSFGIMGVMQLLSFGALLLCFVFTLFRIGSFSTQNPVTLPTLIIYLLIVFSIMRNIFNYPSDYVISTSDLLGNLFQMRIYLLFFLLIMILQYQSDYISIYNLIIQLGVLASIIVILQLVTNTQTSVIRITRQEDLFHLYRLITPTSLLITTAYFFILAKILTEKKITSKGVILLLITSTATIVQLHRGIILPFFGITLYAFFPKLRSNVKFVFGFTIAFVLLFIIVTMIIFPLIGIKSNYLTGYLMGSYEEINAKEGNLWLRLIVLANTFNDVWANYPLFGRGFNWHSKGETSYILNMFTQSPTFDNSYTNILLVFGLVGILCYLFLIYRLFVSFQYILNDKRYAPLHSLALGSHLCLLYVLLTGINTDNLLINTGTTIFILLWGLGYSMFQIKSYQRSNGNFLTHN